MKNLFLIGMPSSGKTSLGKLLAQRLNYGFMDLDSVIVENEKASIADLFREKGEAYFRQAERQALRQIQPDSSLVVSTGGGTPCFFDNMDFIQRNGLSIFLEVSTGELLRRLKSSRKNERPLINLEEEERTLLDALDKKYRNRLSFYQRAHFTIKDDRIGVEMVLEAIGKEKLG
jgi:shikimate kinase